MADQRIEHLLRRAGFGASADELDDYNTRSYSAAVDRLINYELIPDDVDAKIGQPGYAVTVSTVANSPFSPNTVVNDARQRWLFRSFALRRDREFRALLGEQLAFRGRRRFRS